MSTWPVPPTSGILVNHTSDLHVGYRPWSYEETDHMIDDYLDGMVPDVDLFLCTGDITDDGEPYQDARALHMIRRLSLRARHRLLAMGNHDIWVRREKTRQAWEAVYGQLGNTYVDIKGVRFVTFTVDYYDMTGIPWTVPAATWAWLDQVISAAPGPVVLAEHYPPTELGVGPLNQLEPATTFSALIGDHPSVMGMLCGHMHLNMADPKMMSFLMIGGRQLPVVCDVSSMLSINDQSRDVSAQFPSLSAFITIEEGYWDVRFRNHGAHMWDGPGGQRVTRMNLTDHTVISSMG